MNAGDIEDSYPLSPMQQGMLFHSMSTAGAGSYVQHAICDLRENVDVPLFERAWNRVIERHSVLRTAFRIEGVRDPVQEVLRHVEVSWTHEDWRRFTPKDREAWFDAHLGADGHRDFDPKSAPLMRLAMFRLGDEHSRLLWTYHHALLDGRAVRIILGEVFDLYDAWSDGRDLQLPLPPPYRGYVDWLATQDMGAAGQFWKKMLAGHATPTSLALRHQGRTAGGQSTGYAAQEMRLSRQSTDRLLSVARQHRITLNTLVLGAWAQLLSRYSGETDVSFGTTLALRGAGPEAFRDMVGLLINTVPMRVDVQLDTPLLPWLKALRSQWLAMREHSWVPLTAIRQWSDIPRASPLMSTLVVFEHTRLDPALREERKSWTRRDFSRKSGASLPLTVVVFGEPELSLKIVFDRSLFDTATIGPMLEHLRTVLEGAVSDLERPLKDQAFLSEAEKTRLLIQWNDTERLFPLETCTHLLFEQQVERAPDAVAVESGDRALTYRQLNDLSNQLANELQQSGVVPDTLVGICMNRTPEVIVAMLAIMKAGGAYLPLDASYPPERLQYIMNDASLSMVLTTKAAAPRIIGFTGRVILVDEGRNPVAPEGTVNPIANVGLDDLAYAVYTSGSTGLPKGILIPHSALVNHTLMLVEKYNFSAADRRLQFVSIASDVLIADVFPALVAGATVVMWPEANILSVADFLEFLEDRKVTVAALPSAYWHEWVSAMSTGALPFPSALRIVISGMDSVRPDLFAIWKQKASKRIRWFNVYGPSETTCSATSYEADLDGDETLSSVPIGRPLANVRIRILDAHARLVPIGVPGEICIGGRGVAKGYLNRPELTSEKFVRDPFGYGSEDRLYRTGDVGRYLQDGNIEFLGRADDQVKIRGFRVEPGEVEAALRRLPDVREAAVVVHGETPDARQLIGYVVAAAGTQPAPLDLRALLRRTLPEYMVPTAIVLLATMPLTPNGKIDHGALPRPSLAADQRKGWHKPPRDPLEYALAAIWEELLGVRVGVWDNFFDLGGHSLLAVQMMDAVSRACGCSVPLTILFTESTVERLAKALKDTSALSPSPLVALNPAGTRPPFLFLHGDYTGGGFYSDALAKALGPDQPFYAVHPHGIDNTEVPASIEVMAADRLRWVREVRPQGPYMLGGHCYGALVALEMARQLILEGEEVPTVVLIDVKAPWRTKVVFSSDAAETERSRTRHFVPAAPPGPTPNDSVGQRYRRVVAKYAPDNFPGRVAVLRSESMVDIRKSLGWSNVARQVDTHTIPGNHFSAITRHVDALGACIRRCMDDALRR
jgi:amino acid adenylation domain-containing protein